MRPRTSAIAFSIFAAVVGIGFLTWLGFRTAADTRGWIVLRQLDNRDAVTTTVVEIKPEFVKVRSIYDAAVKTLCSSRAHGNICIIGFFLPGDETPTTGSMPRWGDFKPLAVWWGNDASGMREFTLWDCSRAGAEGSPPSALCGAGVKQSYGLALALGQRQGIGEFCNWPPRDDIPGFLTAVLSSMAKYGRADEMRSAYEKTVEGGRNTGSVEHKYDCNTFRGKLDAMVDDAVSAWRAAVEPATPESHR